MARRLRPHLPRQQHGPTICDGDIVCIRRQPEVEQGEIAAVRIGEEATLKHFHRQGETVMLLADNTAVCPPMVFAGPSWKKFKSRAVPWASAVAYNKEESPCLHPKK